MYKWVMRQCFQRGYLNTYGITMLEGNLTDINNSAFCVNHLFRTTAGRWELGSKNLQF